MKENIRILDITKPQKVSYCIPMWLRDEQVRINTVKVKGRIEANYDINPDKIAIVCYGPSLNDTWEQIRDFKYVLTCSGAHKFLIDKGIVPNWHVDVDPRPHKVKLVGTPHENVEYLIASCCHPGYFEHLDGYNIKLWHVFDPAIESMRVLPVGEWALAGGVSAGTRALTMARFLGFTDLHVFGMDGNYSANDNKGAHAGAHPNQMPPVCSVEYDGKQYRTTPAFAEAARQTLHELDVLSDTNITFHGDGLVQAMSKNYIRKPPAPNTSLLAFSKPELISDEFKMLNAQLHKDRLEYGVSGARHAGTVIKLVNLLKNKVPDGIPSVLDYGAGKGYLSKALNFPIWNYDPAVPEISESPRPADLVVCSDTLEHVEPDKLIFVLGDLRRCVKQVGYFVIHMGPAGKRYANGMNTHLIQQRRDWWVDKLSKFFTIMEAVEKVPELYIIAAPLESPEWMVPEAKIEKYCEVETK